MKKSTWLLALGMAASLLPTAPAGAADHRDGAATLTDPSTDVNDVYAWMDATDTNVYLAMTVFPAAAMTSKFSNAAYYVFHTTARATAVTPQPAVSVDITCSFDNSATQNASCWIGDATNFLYGPAGVAAAPLTNAAGTISIFAGARKDHFFFNLDGFNRARSLVKANLASLTFSTAATGSCLTGPAASVLLVKNALSLDKAGASPPADFFQPLDTLAIVLKVPLALINKGTAAVPIISVSAATYRKG